MRKIAYIAKHPETAHGAATKNKVTKSATLFVDATAAATGQAPRTVRVDAWRGAAIIPAALDAIKAGGKTIDKGANRRRHTPGAFGKRWNFRRIMTFSPRRMRRAVQFRRAGYIARIVMLPRLTMAMGFMG